MNILDWFRGERSSAADDAPARQAIERIVDLTNPRLRFARHYRKRLAPAVRAAIDYSRSLVNAVPPARDASPSGWRSDSYLRAFFATADDVARAFSRSPDLRAWFDANVAASEVYVILSMQLTERRVLGVALEDGVLKREVPQTTVSFGDPRARICGVSDSALREELERRLVDQLALAGLAKATHDSLQRKVLEQEAALLRMRLRLKENLGAGVSALVAGKLPEHAELARIQADLAVNDERLKSLAAGTEALDYQLDCVREVLENAREHLFVTSRCIRLDRMNMLVSENSAAPSDTLDLQIARIPMPEGPPEMRTFLLVRFPRAAMLPKSALVSEAARMLH